MMAGMPDQDCSVRHTARNRGEVGGRRAAACEEASLKGRFEARSARHRVGDGTLPGQPLELARRDNPVVLRVGVVVVLDVVEIVDVVHRQTKRTAQPHRRRVTAPVQTLEPGAVGKMKPGDGIEGRLALFGIEEILRTEPAERLPGFQWNRAVVAPALAIQALDNRCDSRTARLQRARRRQPVAEPRDWRQRGERLQMRKRSPRSSTAWLISRLPNDTPRSPS